MLYHFAGSDEQSIELSWEELKVVIDSVGFEMELEDTETCSYVQNNASMLQYNYKTILFTARKPLWTHFIIYFNLFNNLESNIEQSWPYRGSL